MKYRKDKYGNDISVLGFGCMRFPRNGAAIDMRETEKELLAAIENGINYFDTAYIYPGSEAALGEILHKNNLREKVYIATKLPHYLIKSREGMERLFGEHLKRLKTDYIDYYLMHMLTDVQTWERLKDLGILEFLEEKKRSGAIRQIGFSYHGNSDMFCKLVDAYDWDFCQIQYNYLDEHSQAGRRGLQYAHSKGLPVIIMEPLRGGKLVNRLPKTALDIFAAYPIFGTPAQWALRWLWDQPEVTCVLSGMNSMEMVEDNIRTASQANVGDLGAAEQQMLRQVVAAINSVTKGTYAEQIASYAAYAFSEAMQPIAQRLATLRTQYEAMVEHVATIEQEHAGFKELHARRLVESVGHLMIGYLLAREASHHEELYAESATVFCQLAEGKIAEAYTRIMHSTAEDIARYKTE